MKTCKELYESVEYGGLKKTEIQCSQTIKSFLEKFPYSSSIMEEVEGKRPIEQFYHLQTLLLWVIPDYMDLFYNAANQYGYNRLDEIKQAVYMLGELPNPNVNKERIMSLLNIPIIQDVSFDSKDTFTIYSSEYPEIRFQLANKFLEGNAEIEEYFESTTLPNLCYQHTTFLADQFHDNLSTVATCEGLFHHPYHHAYSITPDNETVIDLTYNAVFSQDTFNRLERPKKVLYSKNYNELIRDVQEALKNSNLDPDSYYLLQAAIYEEYLSQENTSTKKLIRTN